MEAKTPKYVQGYWRNKEDEVANEQQSDSLGKVSFYGLLAYCTLLLFTPGWVVGLPIVGTTAAVYSIQRLVKYKNTPKEPKLVINKF